MTKDKLEQYIRNNRDEFDEIEPSADLWEGIVTRKPVISQLDEVVPSKKYSIGSYKWAVRVAAAVILFISSYYFHDYRSNSIQLANQEKASQNNNSELYNTFIEAEYYYTAQIGVEQEKLYGLTVGNTMVREEIQEELKDLDMEFRELKEDLKDNADNEEIIAAMIQNYRLKLSILQDMMMQLQEDNSVKNNNNETKRIHI